MSEPNGDTIRLHAVQRQMIHIEASFDAPNALNPPPVDEVICQLSEFEGGLDELDRILDAETHRAKVMAHKYYASVIGPATEFNIAAIGFLQGVTFAAAVRTLKPVRDTEDELRDVLRQAVRIIARIENQGDAVSREGQDFLADARKALS